MTTSKDVKKVPVHVPGEGMAEVVRRVSQWYKSDFVDFNEASGAINLFQLPGNGLFVRAYVNIETAFDASGTSAAATATITVPGDTGAVTIFDAGSVKLQSSGYTPDTGGTPLHVPSSGGYVILTYTPGTAAAGQLEVYIEYLQNDDLI